jgi:hypothetical protein
MVGGMALHRRRTASEGTINDGKSASLPATQS